MGQEEVRALQREAARKANEREDAERKDDSDEELWGGDTDLDDIFSPSVRLADWRRHTAAPAPAGGSVKWRSAAAST